MSGRARDRRETALGEVRPRGTLSSRGSWVLCAVLLLASLSAPPVVAQEPPSRAELESEYDLVTREFDAALEAAIARREIWEDRVSALDEARRNGSEEAREAAFQELRLAFDDLQRAEERVRELREEVEAARQALLAALIEERAELRMQYAAARDPSESRRTERLLVDLENQVQRLRSEVLPPDPSLALAPSTIPSDPRDGESQIRAKLQLLERQIEEVDSAAARVDGLLEELLTEQRVRQMGEDFRANRDRFGDTELPTGPPRRSSVREEEMPADSTAVQEAVPLEVRIAEAQALRERLMGYRQVLERRAEDFKEQLRRITA